MIIKIKDVEEFEKTELMLYASGKGKRFYIKLSAGPGASRYVVESSNGNKEFEMMLSAVGYFNAI